MAKALTKSQVTAGVAEAAEISKKQAVAAIEALVGMAYKQAKNSFTIPGLGKLVLVTRKARRRHATAPIVSRLREVRRAGRFL